MPEYAKWEQEILANNSDEQVNLSRLMVGVCWVIWILNTIMCYIILMNFLIAIISECYEEIIDKGEQTDYSAKADLNLEALMMYQWQLKKLLYTDIHYIIVSTQKQSKSGKDAFSGIIKSIKTYIDENTETMKSYVKN